MKVSILPLADDAEASLHAAEEEGNHALEETCTEVLNGGTLQVQEDVCFNLILDDTADATTFTIDATGNEFVGIFAQHFLTEFGDEADHLIAPDSGEVAPEHTIPEAGDDHDGHEHGEEESGDDHDGHEHGEEDEHAGHDHGSGNEFEWAGLYHTKGDTYALVLGAVDGSYADPKMKIAVLPLADDSEESLHAAEAEGNHALEQTCTDVPLGGSIPIMEDACFTLVFDEELPQSIFKIDTSANEFVVVFAEHFLSEFGDEGQNLFDVFGEEIEPEHTIPEDGPLDDSKPWGPALGASFCVLLATFSGIVLLVPAVATFRDMNEDLFNACIFAFASGAILATAFFFILFESTHLIAAGWDNETEQIWRYGTVVLSGILLPFVIDVVAKKISGSEEVHPEGNKTNGEKGKINVRVLSGVLFGDFMHNFVDGILIGSAFSGCGDAAGWTVAAATVGHEIAQEIGDYCLLTGAGNLSVVQALGCNFVSGLSVMFGCIIILSADVATETTGLILAFGGGAYVAIGASESMPRVFELAKTDSARAAALVSFFIGATAIGLVLLDHEHCVPEGVSAAADPHAGHNH
jgi:zinc transporter ZupT